MVKIVGMEETTPEEIKGIKGCLGCFSGCLLFFLLVPIVLFWGYYWALSSPPKTQVEWHSGSFYIEHESDIAGQTGNHLVYRINKEEKQELLPHVYGFERDGDFVYIGATQGYAVINRIEGTADIILLEPYLSQIKKVTRENIRYRDDFDIFSEKQMLKIAGVSRILPAYPTSWWTDGGEVAIGDGRFQCAQYCTSGFLQFDLIGYGLLSGDSLHKDSVLLADLTGCSDKYYSKFYAASPHGYAIVDKKASNCRVYFIEKELGEKDYDSAVQVLDSFDQFTPEEQAILLEVEKKGLER